MESVLNPDFALGKTHHEGHEELEWFLDLQKLHELHALHGEYYRTGQQLVEALSRRNAKSIAL